MKLSSKARDLINAAMKDPTQRAALEKYVSHMEAACLVSQVTGLAAAKAAAKNKRMGKV